jgi:hypothetical protein
MLTHQSCGFYRVRRGARAVAAHELKHSREMFPEDARVDMGEARHPRLSVATKGNRALDVAHQPQREGEVQHRRHAGTVSEAKGEIVVTPGLKQRDSAFQMAARFAVLSGEPSRFGAGFADLNRGIFALPICSRNACETSTEA